MADTVTETASLLEKKIIRQIEYYFGDVNLPRDKFLKEKQSEDEGWITLECLTTFNRLKELSTDLKEICTALQKSNNGLLEINSDEFKVRRCKEKPLPDLDDPVYIKKKKMKTLYMKGFPNTYTMDMVADFFLENNFNTVFIKLRKDDEFQFKGSIFVEVSTSEEAERLLKNELKCEEQTLEVMRRDDYYQKKNVDKQGKSNGNSKESGVPKMERKAGAVMHLKNLSEITRREDLKEIFASEPIAWVDYNTNETQGFVRFEEPGAAQRAIDAVKEKNEGKIIVKEVEVEVRVLEGEEEENYWKMTEEEIKKRKSANSMKHRGGRGRQKGKVFKRKRSWENGPRNDKKDNEPQGKLTVFDDEEDGESKTDNNPPSDEKPKDVPSEPKKIKTDGDGNE